MKHWTQIRVTWQMGVLVICLFVLPLFAEHAVRDSGLGEESSGSMVPAIIILLASSLAVWSRIAKVDDSRARGDIIVKIIAGLVLLVLAGGLHFGTQDSENALRIGDRLYIPKGLYALGAFLLVWAMADEAAEAES